MKHFSNFILIPNIIFLLSFSTNKCFSQELLVEKKSELANISKYVYKTSLADVVICLTNDSWRNKYNPHIIWSGSSLSFYFISKNENAILTIKEFEISFNIENHIINKKFELDAFDKLISGGNYKKTTLTEFNEVLYFSKSLNETIIPFSSEIFKQYEKEIDINQDVTPLKSVKIIKLEIVKSSN